MEDEQGIFNLEWKDFSCHIADACRLNRDLNCFTDVTIIAEGKKLAAHKIVLAANSQFFKVIFSEIPPWIHPTVILTNVTYDDFEAVLRYMYTGEFSFHSETIDTFLETASYFQINSLMQVESALLFNQSDEDSEHDSIYDQDILQTPNWSYTDDESNNTTAGSDVKYDSNKNTSIVFDNPKLDLHISTVKESEYFHEDDKENLVSGVLKKGKLVAPSAFPQKGKCMVQNKRPKRGKPNLTCDKKLENGIKAVIGGLSMVKAASKYGISRKYLGKEIQERIKYGLLPELVIARNKNKSLIPKATSELIPKNHNSIYIFCSEVSKNTVSRCMKT